MKHIFFILLILITSKVVKAQEEALDSTRMSINISECLLGWGFGHSTNVNFTYSRKKSEYSIGPTFLLTPLWKSNNIMYARPGLVGLIFNSLEVSKFGDIDSAYDWIIAYGIILGIEMLIFSIFIVKYAFNPKDLSLWTYSKHLMES